MSTWAVDKAGNPYLLPGGKIAIATGLEGVLQTCERVSKMVEGEYEYDTVLGVKTFETALTQYAPASFAASLRANLLRVPGVTAVTNIEAAVRNGGLYYTATIATPYGAATLGGTTL